MAPLAPIFLNAAIGAVEKGVDMAFNPPDFTQKQTFGLG